jgi:hypothetical protein
MTPEPRPDWFRPITAGTVAEEVTESRVVEQGMTARLIFCEVKICTTDGSAFFAASRNEGATSVGASPAHRRLLQGNDTGAPRRAILPSHSGLRVLTTKRTARPTVTVCAKISQSLRMGKTGASE